jgi:hypothetical protein
MEGKRAVAETEGRRETKGCRKAEGHIRKRGPLRWQRAVEVA